MQLTSALLDEERGQDVSALLSERQTFAMEMSACGAFLRRIGALSELFEKRKVQIAAYFSLHRARDFRALTELFINYDILLTQYVYIGAMLGYAADGGLSRGSALYTDKTAEELLAAEEAPAIDTAHAGQVQETFFDVSDGQVTNRFVPVRPIPDAELWFETVYNRGQRR